MAETNRIIQGPATVFVRQGDEFVALGQCFVESVEAAVAGFAVMGRAMSDDGILIENPLTEFDSKRIRRWCGLSRYPKQVP